MFNPNFEITSSILKSIGQIEAAKAVIENSPLLPLYERQFKSEATARKVHFSTAIEGNYLQMSEVKKVISDARLDIIRDEQGSEVIARKRDLHEVINYRDVVKYIEKFNSKDFKLTEEVIKEIHKILLKNIMDEVAGEYRIGTAVTVNYKTGEKLYPYSDSSNVLVKMKELINWYNSDYAHKMNPILRAGILHLEIVRIHPFEEGNGRLARALATLSLSVEGYDVGHFFCLDEFYDSNSQDYYSSLAEGFVNLTIWLEYFALGMSIEFNRVKDRVIKISKDAKIKEKTGQVFITERQEQIIEWLNNFGFFRNQDFSELFSDISDDTVLRELKGLLDAGIVEKKGKTKSARYTLI